MKIIDKYIFKELITPFFLSLFILLFILITQVFVKHIDRFIGKGLSLSVVLKYLLFNSAWIFSLAVPMAALIATMMAFGRLSSDNEISALKSSGISYFNLLKPAIMFGIILLITMIPFNLWILPEINFNNKVLTQKISKSRPDIQIQEYQKNILFGKVIYVEDEINGQFNDVTIFDNNNSNNISIFSKSGNFDSFDDGILLTLKDGSLHSYNQKTDEYQKTYFNNYQISIPFNENNFSDKNLLKGNKEMNIGELLDKINFKKNKISNLEKMLDQDKNQLNLYTLREKKLQTTIDSLSNINKIETDIYNSAYIDLNKIKNSISNLTIKIKNNTNIIPQYFRDINKTSVEIHKKIVLPFACIIFILLGIPLGIISKNGRFSINIALSLAFIILYWAFLTIGIYLAEEGKVTPLLSMWAGNIIIGLIALYLFNISSKENYTFNIKLVNIKSYLIKNK